MADQHVYEAAMRDAANAAWDRDWDRAIAAYQRAIRAAPDDAQALSGLALCLMESGHHDEALTAYERVSQISPSDPLPAEKMAEIHEQAERLDEAAKKYLAAAEIYFARRDMEHAIQNWENAVALNTDLAQAHMRLAVLYEKNPQTHVKAIYSYLNVARLLQGYKQVERAEQALQRAMKLDPTNFDVRNALEDLKRGSPLQRAELHQTIHGQTITAVAPEVSEEDALFEEVRGRTPVDEAARFAMGLLADLIWSGEVPAAAQTPMMQAIDAHQIGDAGKALNYYLQANEAGLNHPALRFNLGVIYLHANHPQEAIKMLARVIDTPEYAIAGNLALGLAYFSQDEIEAASQRLAEALRQADRELNPQTDEGGYDRLLGKMAEMPEDQLMELGKALALYLDDANWRSKLGDTLAGYATQGKTSYVADLVELILEGGRPVIAGIMERVDVFMMRELYTQAMAELHYALEKSPDYLPAHRRIADVLMKINRVQDAAEKINLVANTYLIRGNTEKAADLYAEVLEIWPADIGARQTVIDMLKEQGRVNEALHHYSELADYYHRLMADQARAMEICKEALRYAEEYNADPPAMIAILKAMADIESQRLNWRQALSYYDEVLKLAPDDQETTLAVIDLNFQLGQTDRAIKSLDDYIRYCITRGNVDRVVTILEEQVRRRPDEISLRQRLAEVYRQQGRVEEAIAQLDALGELQLDAGHPDEAAQTIRKIIELNPPDIDGYQQLLKRLESASQ